MAHRHTADASFPRFPRRIFSTAFSMKLAVNPDAAGRDAFWMGRPIWANPLTGDPAREWTAGWKRAHDELTTRCGQDVVTASAANRAAWRTLLRAYRPNDVLPDAG